MSALTVAQRGDLAEEMLPTAALLAAIVHGDGGPEDVAEVLAGLDDTQKNALIVVLAGLVDPDQPVGRSLSWLDVTKHGALPMPSWLEQRRLRDHLPPEAEETSGGYIDQVAVNRFVKGFRVEQLTDEEFLAAVRKCAALGMNCGDIDVLRRWEKKTTQNWINRLRKRYERSGREFPDLGLPKGRAFTEDEVVRIRERSAGGASDVEIGMSYDVSRETIRAICRGDRYPQYGGPIRVKRSAKGLKASREYMCGHGDSSLAARNHNEMEKVA